MPGAGVIGYLHSRYNTNLDLSGILNDCSPNRVDDALRIDTWAIKKGTESVITCNERDDPILATTFPTRKQLEILVSIYDPFSSHARMAPYIDKKPEVHQKQLPHHYSDDSHPAILDPNSLSQIRKHLSDRNPTNSGGPNRNPGWLRSCCSTHLSATKYKQRVTLADADWVDNNFYDHQIS